RMHWATLLVMLSGTFMVVLDFFIVNVAIPSIQRELRASSSAIELVVAGYGMANAAGLITGGRLGDLYGRRRMFAWGLMLFTLASALCGLAPNAGVLVGARVVQGLAGALLQPQVLAMLGLVYTGAARARAFAAYGLALGFGAVGGQLIGGLLIHADPAGLGWRSCFLINVPVGLAALALTPRFIPPLETQGSSRLDLVGTLLVAAGLVAVIAPLVEGRQDGWPLWSWLCLAGAVPVLLFFGAHQKWLATRAGEPLIAPALFAEPVFVTGLLITLIFYLGNASYYFVLALYLQQGRGLGALDSGLVFTALVLGFFATSMAAAPLARWLGRQSFAIGAGVLAAGHLLQYAVVASSTQNASVLW
ncbi:MAG: MFS transporter, partial [Gammaproteobacteria bacterium]